MKVSPSSHTNIASTVDERPPARSRFATILLIVGIIILASNLRAAITSVGPLISAIRADTGLSAGLTGLLTALPLLGFAVLSPLAPQLARRWGLEFVLLVSLVVLAVGILLRSLPSLIALFLGTAALGLAIAVGNVLLPGLVKRDFPTQIGRMTGLYSGVMGVGASLAAGVSVPMSQAFGLGWRGSLTFWIIPVVFALAFWLPLTLLARRRTVEPQIQSVADLRMVWRSPLAWQVTLFMGLQSFAFYSIISWLPTLLRDEGLNAVMAGWMVSLLQLVGFLSTFLVPILAGRRADQRLFVVASILLSLIAFLGILTTGGGLVILWVVILGISQGSYLALALLFFIMRAPDSQTASELSGMAQSVGYLLAAGGPILFGYLHDLTHSWAAPLIMLIIVTLALFFVGLGAGSNTLITRSRS